MVDGAGGGVDGGGAVVFVGAGVGLALVGVVVGAELFVGALLAPPDDDLVDEPEPFDDPLKPWWPDPDTGPQKTLSGRNCRSALGAFGSIGEQAAEASA